MSENQFEIEGLTKFYNRHKVLEVPYLRIGKGSILGIIGPNGAGKSTLLNILGFLLPPTEGKIYFDGMDTDRVDKYVLRQRVTLILQNPFLFNTTVEKNLAYGLKLRGIPRGERERLIRECLELVGLKGWERRKARELSGGEIQKVAFARALVLRPEVLLLDEPTANLDKKSVEVLERVLRDINRESNTTIILATHDLPQVYRLAQEIVYLKGGRLVGTL